MKSVHEYKTIHLERHYQIADEMRWSGNTDGYTNYLDWYIIDKRSNRNRLPIIRYYKKIFRYIHKKSNTRHCTFPF